MSKKLIILTGFLLLLSPCILLSQTRSAFSGDISLFKAELLTFMGPNLNDEQKINLNTFTVRWDSASFSKENMTRIIDVSSQLSARLMRPVPHFINYFKAINSFTRSISDEAFFNNWLSGLSEIAFNPNYTNDNIDKYLVNTGSMIKGNVLFESGSVKWKVKNSTLKFLYDTAFYAAVSNATLTCYSQRDSTEIYNVSGSYYPDIMLFVGNKGIITWEKAGFSGDVVDVGRRKYLFHHEGFVQMERSCF